MSPIQQMLLGVGAGEVVGQQEFTTTGSHSWTAPDGVESISIVLVGGGGGSQGGGGGGGAALVYKNNITVVPGNSYTVFVGAGDQPYPRIGQKSYWISDTTLFANGGGGAIAGSQPGSGGLRDGQGDGGGNGGSGGVSIQTYGGGGGAGGYSGRGGNGRGNNTNETTPSGGGGSGGYSHSSDYRIGGGGGGVGLQGEGSSGTGQGAGGSGGANGSSNGSAGAYGGGEGGRKNQGGADGAVRIIWPGTDRQFPSTRTADE